MEASRQEMDVACVLEVWEDVETESESESEEEDRVFEELELEECVEEQLDASTSTSRDTAGPSRVTVRQTQTYDWQEVTLSKNII